MKSIELKVSFTLLDVIKEWSHQAGNFDKSVQNEIREQKYMSSLMSLFSMFAKYHNDMDDGDFVRSYRFFKDIGLTKRLSTETSVSERYVKLEYQEPGIKEKIDGNN